MNAQEMQQFEAQANGCDQIFFRTIGGAKGHYTSGIKHIVENANLDWLLTDIFIYGLSHDSVTSSRFSVFRFLVHTNGKATLQAEDGNDNVIFDIRYPFCDVPEGLTEWVLFFEETLIGDKVEHLLLLPGER